MAEAANGMSAASSGSEQIRAVPRTNRGMSTLSATDLLKTRIHRPASKAALSSTGGKEEGSRDVRGLTTLSDTGPFSVRIKMPANNMDLVVAKPQASTATISIISEQFEGKLQSDNTVVGSKPSLTSEHRAYTAEPSSTNNSRQFLMLVSLVTIVVALLLGVTLYYLRDSAVTRYNVLKDREAVIRSAKLGDLEHVLQVERDQSVLYLSVISPKTKTFLMECYVNTDSVLKDIPWPDNLDRKGRPEYATKSAFVMHMKQHRKMLDILGNTIFEEMDFYAKDIKTLMLWLNDALSQSRYSNMWKSLVAYEYMISAKELAATERTLGGYFFSNGGFDNMEQYSLYSMQMNVFRSRYSRARGHSKIVPPVAISNIDIGGIDLSRVIDQYRNQIKYIDLNETSLDLAFGYFNMMSMYIDHLFDVQKQIEGTLVRGIADLAKHKLVPIIASSCILGILCIIYPVVIRILQQNTKKFNSFSIQLIQQNKKLAVEKKRTEQLLYQILPRYVANQLKTIEGLSANYFPSVTILFTNIIGFTRNMPLVGDPNKMVTLLNDIDTLIEDRIRMYNVCKIETIGESYMITAGLPEESDDHFCEIADFALDLMTTCSDLLMNDMHTGKLSLRIGIHSGSVMAGVVSAAMPRYCVFGSTVLSAANIETNGIADKIQISYNTYELLDRTGLYKMEARKNDSMNGFRVYLLLACKGRRIVRFGKTGRQLPTSFSYSADSMNPPRRSHDVTPLAIEPADVGQKSHRT